MYMQTVFISMFSKIPNLHTAGRISLDCEVQESCITLEAKDAYHSLLQIYVVRFLVVVQNLSWRKDNSYDRYYQSYTQTVSTAYTV